MSDWVDSTLYYVGMSSRSEPTTRVSPSIVLPEGTILLHIGPHKTGTTSLQNSVRANRDEILRQGVY